MGSYRNSFQVLGIVNKEMDKIHRKGNEDSLLLSMEKNYALQNASGTQKIHSGHEVRGSNLLCLLFLCLLSDLSHPIKRLLSFDPDVNEELKIALSNSGCNA